MKHLKTFEQQSPKPNVNSVSPEFWKMVEIADWKQVIDSQKLHTKIDQEYRDFTNDAKLRIYSVYTYPEIKNFHSECTKIYHQLYDYFESTWLDKQYDFMPSDDGYWDLLSSMIGLGKEFTQKCIDDKNNFIKLAKDDYYAENFSYILNPDKEDYNYIINQYPLDKNVKKYNL